MPKLKVVKGNGTKVYPVTIVKGIYDTENSQPLSATLTAKADSTTLEEAVKDGRSFAVLVALTNSLLYNTTWEVSSNPEYTYCLTDSEDKIILAKKVDGGDWVLGDDIDTLFDDIVPNIDNTLERKLSDLRISDAYTKTEVDALLTESYFTRADTAMFIACMYILQKDSTVSIEENPEWKWVMTDSEDKILFGIKEDGTLYQGLEWSELLDLLVENYTVEAEVAAVGTFSEVPASPSVGQAFFCTDKQTTEGATNGIMIYYNGTAWVDALGRSVETTDSSEETGTTETTSES